MKFRIYFFWFLLTSVQIYSSDKSTFQLRLGAQTYTAKPSDDENSYDVTFTHSVKDAGENFLSFKNLPVTTAVIPCLYKEDASQQKEQSLIIVLEKLSDSILFQGTFLGELVCCPSHTFDAKTAVELDKADKSKSFLQKLILEKPEGVRCLLPPIMFKTASLFYIIDEAPQSASADFGLPSLQVTSLYCLITTFFKTLNHQKFSASLTLDEKKFELLIKAVKKLIEKQGVATLEEAIDSEKSLIEHYRLLLLEDID